jgi:hypothetical protein
MMLSAHSTGSSAAALQPQHKRAVLTRPGRSSMRVSATAATAPPAATSGTDAADRAKVVQEESQYVLQTYGRPADVVFVRGQGTKLYDISGREYLDMAAGALHCTHTWRSASTHMCTSLTLLCWVHFRKFTLNPYTVLDPAWDDFCLNHCILTQNTPTPPCTLLLPVSQALR